MMGGKKSHDVEAGINPLYPNMIENPQLRWAFIRKVYAILSMQLVLTAAVAATVVYVQPVAHFIRHTPAGLGVYIAVIIITFILLFLLHAYHNKHPLNFLLLGLFTVAIAFPIGLTCAFVKGKIILQAAILTGAMVISLTLYTFWAVRRGKDFSFLGPFLFGSFIILLIFGVFQFLFPFGKIGTTVFAALAAILFCAYIVYDTSNLINNLSYDEYILAAVQLYLDITNLFSFILCFMDNAEG